MSIQEIYESEFEKEKPGFLQGETGIERAAAGRGHSRLGGAGSGGAGGAVAEEHPVHPAGPDAAEDPAYPAAVVAHRPGGEEAQLPVVGAGTYPAGPVRLEYAAHAGQPPAGEDLGPAEAAAPLH